MGSWGHGERSAEAPGRSLPPPSTVRP
ncbi:CRISPR-associated protein Cas5 [Streptomyces humicola]